MSESGVAFRVISRFTILMAFLSCNCTADVPAEHGAHDESDGILERDRYVVPDCLQQSNGL